MFKHNWAWIKLATDNFSTVLTRNLRNPRDCAPLKMRPVRKVAPGLQMKFSESGKVTQGGKKRSESLVYLKVIS